MENSFLEIEDSYIDSEVFFKTFFSNPRDDIDDWSHSQVYPQGVEIVQQDTPANYVYFIERGIIKLSCLESGGHSVIISLRRSNWLLGAPAIFLARPYAFTATTLTPCSLLTIPARHFLDLVKINKEFSWHLFRMLSKKIYDYKAQAIALGIIRAKERLKNILYEMILQQEPTGLKGQIQVHLPFTHKDLSQLVSVSPEHLCRLLRELEKQGVIKRNKGLIVVNEPSALLK